MECVRVCVKFQKPFPAHMRRCAAAGLPTQLLLLLMPLLLLTSLFCLFCLRFYSIFCRLL